MPRLSSEAEYCSPVGSFVLIDSPSHNILMSKSGLPADYDGKTNVMFVSCYEIQGSHASLEVWKKI